jgi:Bacteriophage HK97-gp10, putative tail-component
MASSMAGVVWKGMREYADELAALPREVAAEAAAIVYDEATQAADEIRASYPVVSGELRNSVRVVDRSRDLTATTKVINTAKYAVPFEFGTQVRHTKRGFNRGAIAKPGANVFVPITVRHRRAALQRVIAAIETHGAKVTTAA